ncbi:MAG: NUDIX domain-containing protein [Bacteroidota bacterium]
MNKIIDKLAWIEIQDKKILSTRSKGKEVYYIPGGKRETGESDHVALIREIKEELSVDLIADSLKYLGTWEAQAHSHPAGVLVRMTCYTGKYTGTLAPAAEIAGMAWLDYGHYAEISPVDKIIFDWLLSKKMIGCR